ncbi:HXXXD-type acyl-transferase family protein [Forsythia ovata]|uniref:HXXXD-type acyl-transferase family protein n=1 Tax=Forsythia ovata TaxID=205694 RepID=A0ABD1VDI6_9LAMI
MVEIHVISTCAIKPTADDCQDESKIHLTPWDLELLLLEYSQKGLLFNKPTTEQEKSLLSENITFIDHFKTSLSRTLNFFPLLAGRLAATKVEGRSTSFFIDCDNIGALFIHATVNDLTVADILNPTYVPCIVHSFFPLNGVRNYDGVSQPLLAVQVTELVDGFFIGCSINHLLVDGTSFWHFFNSWAEFSRGYDCVSKPPFLKRELHFDTECSRNIAIDNEQLILNELLNVPPLEERVFHFTKENIAKLKAKANLEMNTSIISSLQALLAHLWRSIISSHCVDANQQTTFEIPIGIRQRLNPPLQEEYFGNAVFPGVVTLPVGKILDEGLGWTAWKVNRMVASRGHEQVKNFYESWVKKPELLKFDNLPKNHFILINSPRFDVYGNDFGWGKPVAVRSGKGNRFDGKIVISAGAEEGSVDIEACLSPQTLHAMSEDATCS